ncbi:MAG: GNAT family N-acetyltransferase [Chthoniobacteraceae bacterium]
MKADVRVISAADTVVIRWPVLRPGFPRETAVFDGDDATTTLHLGAFDGAKLVGVASIYLAACPAKPDASPAFQLRGMATLPEIRGAGFGKALLDACVAAALEEGATLLWCNARTGAVPFYRKNGWATLGDEFDIPTVGPHFRMFRELQAR